jgi:HSP20 family protein
MPIFYKVKDLNLYQIVHTNKAMKGGCPMEPAIFRVFDDAFRSPIGVSLNRSGFVPEVDVRGDNDRVLIQCDIPGLKREDIEVSIDNHILTISGQRKYDAKDNEKVVIGRRYGSFRRTLTLPDYLDEDKLTADLTDGVLTVTIPKSERLKPRRIQITSG